MEHDPAVGGESVQPDEAAPADQTRVVPTTRPPALASSRNRESTRSGSSQLTKLLEEAAGLTLDMLDVVGDAIAKRIGLRRDTAP